MRITKKINNNVALALDSAGKVALSDAEDGKTYLYVCHPGYVDSYLLEHSSLTLERAQEADMLCDSEIRTWLRRQGFELVTYDRLARGAE